MPLELLYGLPAAVLFAIVVAVLVNRRERARALEKPPIERDRTRDDPSVMAVGLLFGVGGLIYFWWNREAIAPDLLIAATAVDAFASGLVAAGLIRHFTER